MTDSRKDSGSGGVGPVEHDFVGALDGIDDDVFSSSVAVKPKADPQTIRRVSAAAGFPSRPVIDETVPDVAPAEPSEPVSKQSRRPQRHTIGTTPRVALRTDPAAFARLKAIAQSQRPPWTIGYAFEMAVQALDRELDGQ